MKLKVPFLLISLFLLSSCAIIQGIMSTYALKDCEYKYNSISGISLSGINVSEGLNVLNLTRVMALFGGQTTSLPLAFSLNLDVHNPNAQKAGFQKVDYIVTIDNIHFSSGASTAPFSVEAGGNNLLPIRLEVDLMTLAKENSLTTVLNMAKNFIGIGADPTQVKVEIKPTIQISEKSSFTSPTYIPIHFEFGGKQ